MSGKVKHAYCTCVADSVGFCNHVLALMMKICKFTLYECKNVNDLDNEGDMQAKQSCTSMLQQWHRKGRGDTTAPQPVMEVFVYKTHQDQDRSSSKEQGVRCLLYEAQTIKAIKGQQADENKLLAKLQAINKKNGPSTDHDSHLIKHPTRRNKIWQKPSRFFWKLSAFNYRGQF